MARSISSCSSSPRAVAAQNARKPSRYGKQKSAAPRLPLVALDVLPVILVIAVALRVIHQRHQADADEERKAGATDDRQPAPGRNIDSGHGPLVVGDPEDKREQGQERSDRERSCHVDLPGCAASEWRSCISYGVGSPFAKWVRARGSGPRELSAPRCIDMVARSLPCARQY